MARTGPALEIIPEERMKAYQRPAKTIPRVKGSHEDDWIRACKEGSDGKPASSNFEYGGALTEMVLLGMAAIQMKDQNLRWDTKNLALHEQRRRQRVNQSALPRRLEVVAI